MKKLLALLVIATIMLSFATTRPEKHSNPTPLYRMSVTHCGYSDFYAAAIGAGHMEWQLQQQGYGNFEVNIQCNGDMCWDMCYTVYYSLASYNITDSVHKKESDDGLIYKKY